MAEGEADARGRDATDGEAVIARMIGAGRDLAAEDLADLVTDSAQRAGLGAATVYVTDYEQRLLMPLRPRSDSVGAVPIDSTLAGRAFQTAQTQESPAAGGRLWVPIDTGAERVGVLQIDGPPGADRTRLARLLADVTGLLLISRLRFSDYVEQMRRRDVMSLAAEIQWALLPPLACVTRRIAISAVVEPSYEIAGDSFDYAIDRDIARVAIFDAMGHGFEATRMALLAIGAYRHGRRGGVPLESQREAVDDVLARHFDTGQFVTGQFAELDGHTGRLRWLNAGHPAPLLIRQRSVVARLECAPTLPLGLGGNVVEVAEEQLEPGDRVLLFTDGVTEARSPSGKFFGDDRLDDFVNASELRDLPVSETLRRLAHTLVDYQDGPAQDDATMVLLEWRAHDRAGGDGDAAVT